MACSIPISRIEFKDSGTDQHNIGWDVLYVTETDFPEVMRERRGKEWELR